MAETAQFINLVCGGTNYDDRPKPVFGGGEEGGIVRMRRGMMIRGFRSDTGLDTHYPTGADNRLWTDMEMIVRYRKET